MKRILPLQASGNQLSQLLRASLSQRLLPAILLLITGCQPVAEPEARWQRYSAGTQAAALSQGGQVAATVTQSGPIRLYDSQQAVRYRFYHPVVTAQEAPAEQATGAVAGDEPHQIYLLALSASGNRLLSAEPERLALWDTIHGQSLGLWPLDPPTAGRTPGTITDIALSAQGRYLLVGLSNGEVTHLDTENGRRLTFLGHNERVNSVALSPNGRYALSGSSDYTASLWDTRSGQPLQRFFHASRITQVALDSQGAYGFTADSQQQATIWDLRQGEAHSQLQLPDEGYNSERRFTAARFSTDGQWLLTGSPGRLLRLWRVSDGSLATSWQSPAGNRGAASGGVIDAVAFDSPAGSSRGAGHVRSESSAGYGERWLIPDSALQPQTEEVTAPAAPAAE